MRWARRVAAAVTIVVAAVSGVAAQTQRVGVFFDENAQSCVGEISNHSEVTAHVFAFVTPGTVLNGAILGLELPAGFVLRETILPKQSNSEGLLTASTGLDVTLWSCPVATGPVLLVSFTLRQADFSLPGGARTPNVALRLRGGAVLADSLVKEKPHVKLCPEDPINGVPTFVEVESQGAMLNCDGDCPCTTAVQAATWTRLKSVFRKP